MAARPLSRLLQLLLPEHCSLCRQPADGPVCEDCRGELPWNRTACPRCALPQDGIASLCGSCAGAPPPFDASWSAFRYATPIDKAVQGLKYHAGFRSALWLGREMGLALAPRPEPLPYPDRSFDCCYSHMLFCMALTEAELRFLTREILRVLRPGGFCIYTVRSTRDPDFGKGPHHGEGLYESGGFIIHFFGAATVERLADGFEIVELSEFEEGSLPRRLYLATLRKPKPST